MAQYEIKIVTGTVDGAGTDANVYLILEGTEGKSNEWHLENNEDNFERGKTDSFTQEASVHLGTLKKAIIRHDNSNPRPGWFLQRVEITDKNTNKLYSNTPSRWLAIDEEPRSISIEVPLS
jgi:hypothetical protein